MEPLFSDDDESDLLLLVVIHVSVISLESITSIVLRIDINQDLLTQSEKASVACHRARVLFRTPKLIAGPLGS